MWLGSWGDRRGQHGRHDVPAPGLGRRSRAARLGVRPPHPGRAGLCGGARGPRPGAQPAQRRTQPRLRHRVRPLGRASRHTAMTVLWPARGSRLGELPGGRGAAGAPGLTPPSPLRSFIITHLRNCFVRRNITNILTV